MSERNLAVVDAGAVKLRPVTNQSADLYKVKLRGVAGRVEACDEDGDLLTGVSELRTAQLAQAFSALPRGQGPSTVLQLQAADGELETLVVDPIHFRYDAKRDVLTGRVELHTPEELAALQQSDSPLADEAQLVDGEFEQDFVGGELVVQGWMKSTEVTVRNSTNSTLTLLNMEQQSGWSKAGWGTYLDIALSTVGSVAGLMTSAITGPVSAFLAVNEVRSLYHTLVDLFGPGDVMQPVDKKPSMRLAPGEKISYVNSDVRFGIANGVRDVNFILVAESPDGRSAVNLGLFQADNPLIGRPKSFYAQSLEREQFWQNAAYSPQLLCESVDGMRCSKGFGIDAVAGLSGTASYQGERDRGGPDAVKAWELNVNGSLNW